MKLTKADREYLKRNFWENDDDIDQIEEAISKTSFKVFDMGSEELRNGKEGGKRITLSETIDLLGREVFLSGMDRCAFHVTAVRYTNDGRTVFFDASRYFGY